MTQEEKAKRYDEKLDVARHIYADPSVKDEDKYYIEVIFPELAESEDEKIRKELIDIVAKSPITFAFEDKNKVLSWLEKQGGHTDKIVERAKTEKQRVLITESDGEANIDWDTRSLQDVKLLLEYGLNYANKLEKQDGEKPFDYENADIQQKDFAPKETVKEAESNLTPLERKVKDILFSFHINADDGISFDGTMAIVHNLITLCQQEQKPAWSEEDENTIKILMNIIRKSEIIDSIIYTDSLKEKLYDWLKSLRPQSKQEWSEKDESLRLRTIGALATCKIGSPTKCVDEQINWLKSIKQRLGGKL